MARVRHSSQGEPFLHIEGNLLAVPGDTKHVCRSLLQYMDT